MREKQIDKKQADFVAFPREYSAGRFLGSVIIHLYGPSCLPQLPPCRVTAVVWEADQRPRGMEGCPGFEGTQLRGQPPTPLHLQSPHLPSCVALGKFHIFFQP